MSGIAASLDLYQKHTIAIRYWLLGRQYHKAAEAMEFACKYHLGTRKDGITPEVMHQIEIAHHIRTLPELRSPEDALAGAFLHDVVEDYHIPLKEIESVFGSTIREVVDLLSKEIDGKKKDLRAYFDAIGENPTASVVKGSDRIHNHQTMPDAFTVQKQKQYIEETEKYILPMLKAARRRFPDQELAYENIKHTLHSQIELLKLTWD